MDTPTASPNLSRARVLVVDDHPSTAVTLARAISQLGPGIEVISATSGEMALECVRDGAVDLVITDMMMPNMNGLELIEKLRSHPGGRPTYTILITAYDVPGLRESARRLKVNETIIKPVQPDHICRTVGRALEDMGYSQLPKPVPDSQPHFTILVADDNPDNVSLLSRYLQHEGYGFIAASNGVETLEKTRTEMPDLILLDINMPEKDGLQVLQEVRADPALAHIPVIILTAARVHPADMQNGLSLGADDYVTKPFDRRELLARIRTKLRAKEADRAIRRRYKELSVLPEIGKDLSARLDIDDLTDVVLRRTVETLGAMYGHIIILNPGGSFQKTYRVFAAPASETQLPSFDELIQQIKDTGQSLVIEDTRNDTRWPAMPEDRVRSAVIVPLTGRLDLIGLLVLTHEQAGYFKSDHLLLLQAIASQAAIAMENARLHASMTREQQRSAAILQSAADSILMFDAGSRLVSLNPAGEKLFTDYQAKIGQPLDTGNGYEAFTAILEEALTSGMPKAAEIAWPDHRAFSVQLMPLEEDGCVAVLHDVTHFKDLERVKNEFISTTYHNLKHPITVVTGFVQLLSRVGPLNERQLGYIHQINIATENMDVMVQNMLELVSVDMGAGREMKREIMDLCAVVSEVADEFRPQAEAKGQMLQLDKTEERLTVQVDPLQLRQALRNLVNNAIKYTPHGGSITLSLETPDRQVVVNVRDTGYGIPPEDLPFIFDRFYRVRNSDTKGIQGNGLGLAIVKSIVEQHGGQISVESIPGKGSCFTFTLPLMQKELPAVLNSQINHSSSKNNP